ncbi:MAG: hypothetical protein ABIQ27_07260 [Flavobacterium sp.]|uniref:hypothetical protein n=1 Tax=Flavobacterium sp. TaxID=239 RepID=UPI0032676683
MELKVFMGKDPEVLDFTITNNSNPNIEIICYKGAKSANIFNINESKTFTQGKFKLALDSYSIRIEKIGANPDPNDPPYVILKSTS